MPTVRNIVSSFRFETAAGKRSCDVSSDHAINPGEKHFAYESPPGHRKNICMKCAPSILAKAKNHLEAVISEINK